MRREELDRVSRGVMSEEARREALHAAQTATRYVVDPENVVPFYPASPLEAKLLGMEAASRGHERGP